MGKAAKVGDVEAGSSLAAPLVPAQGAAPVSKRRGLTAEAIASYRSYKAYWENLRLAFFIAVWVTIFSLPTYSTTCQHLLFGEANGKGTPCGVADVGTKEDGTFCGLLPWSYFAYWPNVVQMIVFTVFATTGNTMQLAAQGVLGTAAAAINYSIMLTIWPDGATDPDTYNEPAAWANFIIIVFLFLASTAPENAIKFGLSWHVTFMMNFMNPNKVAQTRHGYIPTNFLGTHWDSEMMVVMLTSITGAFLAIVGTLFPVPLLNLTRIDDDAVALQQEFKKIWSDAIGYFCGNKITAKHYAIETRIDSVSPMVARIKANLSITWWETFDLGYFGSARTLFVAYATLVEGMEDVLHSLKTAIHSEDFTGSHSGFCQALKPQMESLKDRACELMLMCANACMDGHISDEEEKQLAEKRMSVIEAQKALHDAYNSLSKDEAKSYPYVSQDLANENLFIFALSACSRYVTDFSDTVDDIYRNYSGSIMDSLKKTFGGLCSQILGLYRPSRMPKGHVIFAVRNLISITVCFVIGMYSNSSVFTAFSGTMASTCSLLISKFSGSAFQKNLQRLLGLALGKVLPLLVMAALGVFAQVFPELLSPAHGAAILLYMFVFVYMAFTSMQWGGVGCIVAGFGCYGLLQTPIEGGNDAMFASLYKEIGQVTFAIIVQLIVDASFMMPSPRDLALGHMDTLNKEYTEAFQSFFSGNLLTMEAEAIDMRESWEAAYGLAPECDPKLVVVPGKRSPFKIGLYAEVLKLLKTLRADFKMLVMAMKDWKPQPTPKDGDDVDAAKKVVTEDPSQSELLAILHKLSSMGPIKGHVLEHLKTTLDLFGDIMSHSSEDRIDSPNMRNLVDRFTPGESRLNVDDLAKEINESPKIQEEVKKVKYESKNVHELTSDRRVRLTVALRALERAVEHMGMIDALLLQEHVF